MTANQQQADAWNGSEGAHWVENADRYDRQVAAVTDALFACLALRPGEAVLDVGCGSGALARRAAPVSRRVVGADISEPLVALARERARAESLDNVEFVAADVQSYPFDEGAFDVVVSQFGVMFFDEPVTAFANLRRSLVPGGRLAFSSWQEMGASEWVSIVAAAVAEHAAVPSLGGLAGGPGMFALKDRGEIVALLDDAGFGGVEVVAASPTLLIGGGGTLDESASFLLDMGIVRGLLGNLDPDQRAGAVETIRRSLAEHFEPGVGIRLDAAVWLVSATS